MEDELVDDPDEAGALSAALMDAVSPPVLRRLSLMSRMQQAGDTSFEHPRARRPAARHGPGLLGARKMSATTTNRSWKTEDDSPLSLVRRAPRCSLAAPLVPHRFRSVLLPVSKNNIEVGHLGTGGLGRGCLP